METSPVDRVFDQLAEATLGVAVGDGAKGTVLDLSAVGPRKDRQDLFLVALADFLNPFLTLKHVYL